ARAAHLAAIRQQSHSYLAALGRERAAQRAEQQLHLERTLLDLHQQCSRLLSDYAAEREALHHTQQQQRRAEVARIHAAVQHMLHDYAATRQALQSEQLARLANDLDALRLSTEQQIATNAGERALRSAQVQQRLASDAQQRSESVMALLHQYRDARLARAAQLHEQLEASAHQRRSAVATQLSDFAQSRQQRNLVYLAALPPNAASQTAAATVQPISLRSAPLLQAAVPGLAHLPGRSGAPDVAQRLAQGGILAYAQMARVSIARELDNHGATLSDEQQQQIKAQIDGLANSVADLVREIVLARSAMSDVQRQQIGDYVDGLGRTIQALQHDVMVLQAKLSTAPESHRRFAAGLNNILAMIARDVENATALLDLLPGNISSMPQRDDLTVIRGIGPQMQQRLNQAGINTYRQVAGSTPEELRHALGSLRLANVDEWIAAARVAC
ncbi:hypothetical protein HC891_21545, partial [Candidatus Gracilibacteria bacterium]|nr:hypothetical protein [Candidatus Gracilibacteria bacterium]